MNLPQETVAGYWRAIVERDWAALEALLADDVVYEVVQTRERVRGREAVIRFTAEYPGEWAVDVQRIVAQEGAAASWIDFRLDGIAQPGITFFVFSSDGRIAHITDFWPEPYEPPLGRSHLAERY